MTETVLIPRSKSYGHTYIRITLGKHLSMSVLESKLKPETESKKRVVWTALIPDPLFMAVCMAKGTMSVAASVTWWLGHSFGRKGPKSSPRCTEYFEVDR